MYKITSAALTLWVLVLASYSSVLVGRVEAQDANNCGYVQGNSGWFRRSDRSGPYALDSSCRALLLGTVEPPLTAKPLVTTSVTLPANVSTVLAAANPDRLSWSVQCASGGVSVDENGGLMTSAGVGSGTVFIPQGTTVPYYPPVVVRSTITGYTASPQRCVVTESVR